MPAGRPKVIEGKLTNFNAKIEEQKKALIDALIKVGPFDSKRELIDYWLDIHKKANQEHFSKAQKFLELKE